MGISSASKKVQIAPSLMDRENARPMLQRPRYPLINHLVRGKRNLYLLPLPQEGHTDEIAVTIQKEGIIFLLSLVA